jgi:hypothetical protein
MAHAKLGPRVFRRPITAIVEKVEEYIRVFDDDHTVEVYLNKADEDTPIDDLIEHAPVNTYIEIRITKDGDDKPTRQEFYTVVTAPQAVAGTTGAAGPKDPLLAEVANTLKQSNELHSKSVQTIGDLHRILQEQIKGQLAMSKTMAKLLKAASKATRKSFKDRKRAEEQTGIVGALSGIGKELNDAVGPEITKELVMGGIDVVKDVVSVIRSRKGANNGPDTGGEKTVPETPEGGKSPGADAKT